MPPLEEGEHLGPHARVRAADWLGLPMEAMARVPMAVIAAILARAEESLPRPETLHQELLEHVQTSMSMLKHAAYADLLTGLPNRRAMERQLLFELNRAQLVGRPVALFLLDVDDFKAVNDQLGHPAGDTVLRAVAARLRGAVRHGDEVGRWGGDEFVVICPGASDDGIERIATHVADAVASAPVELNGESTRLTVSIGCAVSAIGDATALIAAADAAMYRTKAVRKSPGGPAKTASAAPDS